MSERPSQRFAEYASRAIDGLTRESPLHFAAAKRALKGRAASIRIGDDPPLSISLEAPPWVIRSEAGDIAVSLTPTDLDAMLRGELTLEDAVETDRIHLRGELGHLSDFLDALHAWLHGALRSPELARLHGNYLSGGRDRPVGD